MINGVHTILYSDDADATRTCLSEVLGWSSIDSGGGWLISQTPPTDMGIHPTTSAEGDVWQTTPHHDISFLCHAIEPTTPQLPDKSTTYTTAGRDRGSPLLPPPL